MYNLIKKQLSIGGKVTEIELSNASYDRREVDLFRSKLLKSLDSSSETIVTIVEDECLSVDERAVFPGGSLIRQSFRLCKVPVELDVLVDLAVALGFRPKYGDSDLTTLKGELTDLILKLKASRNLALTEVAADYFKLCTHGIQLDESDVDKVLDFDFKRLNAKFSGIGRGPYKRIFLQHGLLIIGSGF